MRLVSVDERSALIKFFSFSLCTAHFSEEKDCWLVKIVVMFFLTNIILHMHAHKFRR